MHVENDTDMSRWIAGTLTEMRNMNMPIISESCRGVRHRRLK
jgi:hypothetical protein